METQSSLGDKTGAKSNLTIFLLFALASILLSSVVYALPDDQQNYVIGHKANTPLDLVVTTNSTVCNVTFIQYADGSKSAFNLTMTRDGFSFSRLMTAGNYSTLGTTCHGIICTDGTVTQYGSICREVTMTGKTSVTNFIYIFIAIIALLFILGFVMKNEYILFFGSSLIIVFGLWIVINGIDLIKEPTTTWAVGLVLWVLGIYGLYLSIEEMIKEWD